jgi:class 3 adenylate cyclase
MFGMFDECAVQCGVTKIKTIGDAYIAGCNVESENVSDHADKMMEFGVNMLKVVDQLNKMAWMQETGVTLRIRIGIHTGI